MKEFNERYLTSRGALGSKLPNVITQVANSIYAGGLPEKMKLTIAFAEVMLYAGQFRRHIHHWNGSAVPVNAITILLAESGKGKDRAVKEARRCFHSGYKLIEAEREAKARQLAEKLAAEAGEQNPQTAWKDYYKKPVDLFTAITNSSALLDHIADLEASGIGAGYVFSGEFGTELQSNPDLMSTIKDISELYDVGSRETKPLKDRTKQTAAISCMSVNALLVSSPDNILYDETNKKKIRTELSTKLGRRANFGYITEVMERPPQKQIHGLTQEQIDKEVETRAAAKIINEDRILAMRHSTDMATKAVTEYQLKNIGRVITVDPEVRKLFEVYLEYNEERAEDISKLYPISRLVRGHLQWKALKLAGAIAFFNTSETITAQDYIEAINFVELLDNDMFLFETELVKEPYELFVSYMHAQEQNNVATIGLHKLRKMGYIPITGKPEGRIKELIELASSYDKSGIYSATEDGVKYNRIVKTNAAGVSYLPVTGSKEQRAKMCASGYQHIELEFQALRQMLEGDYAYSPFKFANGKRGKENLLGGCKWISLDIDRAILTDKECHELLQDFNHHIVRTSDAENQFKYRVLLELDSYVDLKDSLWKHFIKSIAEHLSLEADLLPKSQIFFSYAGREVLSVVNAKPLEVKEHLLYAHSREEDKDAPELTKAQKSAKLADPDTFNFAYEAPDGQGSRMMYAAVRKAKQLGATKEEAIALLHDINNFWVCPMPKSRLDALIDQTKRMYHE